MTTNVSTDHNADINSGHNRQWRDPLSRVLLHPYAAIFCALCVP